MSPSNSRYSSGWSSVWTARLLRFGSGGMPRGTAHDSSTPSCSRRRSQCRRRAWCSWITNRPPGSPSSGPPVGSGVASKSRFARYRSIRLLTPPWSQGFAVYAVLASHPLAETFHDTGDGFVILGQQVVDHLVGGDGLGAELAEKVYDSTLTGSQRAGDGYRHRPPLGLPMIRGRSYSRSPRSRSLRASKAPVLRPSPTRSWPPRSLSRSPRSLSRSR